MVKSNFSFVISSCMVYIYNFLLMMLVAFIIHVGTIDLIICCLDAYAIPANSVTPNLSSTQSYTLLALNLKPIFFLPVFAFITLHEYFGG